MKNLVLILAFIISQWQLGAQNSPGPGYLSQLTFPWVEVPVEGDPYYEETFRLGEVLFEGEIFRFYFRYNALRDRIELKDASKRLFHLQKNEIIEPKFGGKIYQLKSYFENDTLRKGYLSPLNKGKTVLYYKPKKIFVQAKKPDHGYESYNPPHYKDVLLYFIQFGNYLPKPIDLNRKSLLNALQSRKLELKEYATRNQLDLRNERDAIILVNYFNRITHNPSK